MCFSYTAKVILPPPKEGEKRLEKSIDMNEVNRFIKIPCSVASLLGD